MELLRAGAADTGPAREQRAPPAGRHDEHGHPAAAVTGAAARDRAAALDVHQPPCGRGHPAARAYLAPSLSAATVHCPGLFAAIPSGTLGEHDGHRHCGPDSPDADGRDRRHASKAPGSGKPSRRDRCLPVRAGPGNRLHSAYLGVFDPGHILAPGDHGHGSDDLDRRFLPAGCPAREPDQGHPGSNGHRGTRTAPHLQHVTRGPAEHQ